jgi:hypothetical protein
VPAPWTGWGISAGFTLAALAGGIVAFRRMEAQLADTVQ